MKTLNPKKLLIALAAFLSLSVGSNSLAQTVEGITISNMAQLTFDVGGDTGLTLNSDPDGNSDLAAAGVDTDFFVDRKIDLTVTAVGSATAVPGEDSVVLEYSVMNDTNGIMDFILEAETAGADLTTTNTSISAPGGGSGDPLTDTAVSDVRIYLEASDATSVGFNVLDDTEIDTIDNLGIGLDQTVYVVVDLANVAMATDDYLFVSLVARAANDTDGVLIGVDSNGYAADNVTAKVAATTDSPTVIDDVFADGTSLLAYTGSAFVADDLERNGQVSDHSIIAIEPGLEVTKTVATIFDTLNQDDDPKAIPGAFIQYTITIENLSSGTAFTLTNIQDTLDGNITLDPSLLDPGSCTFLAVAPGPAPEAAQTFVPDDLTCDSLDGTAYTTGVSILEATLTGDVLATASAYFPSATIVSHPGGAGGSLTINLATMLVDAVFGAGYLNTGGVLQAGDSLELVFNAKVN